MEDELFNLQARRATFTPVMRTRAQRAREPSPLATIEEVDESTVERDPSPEPEEPIQLSRIIVPVPDVIITPPSVKEPEHPFRHAKDASYTPPSSRNVGTAVKIPLLYNNKSLSTGV